MRICSHPGCGVLTAKAHCIKHERKHGWASTSRHARGYGTEWDKQRERILKRDNYLCQDECKRSGRVTAATEVDHIIPKAKGGSGDDSNLQSICGGCHRAKTVRER